MKAFVRASKFQHNDIYQFIDTTTELEIQELHVSTMPALEQFIQPFDLAADTLFRCSLIYVDNEAPVLFIDIHHIVCDGISQVLLFTDLLKSYDGITPQLLPIQYKDYAAWEQKFKQNPEYKKNGEFWLNTLSGDLPKIDWPVNITADSGKKGNNHFFDIDEKLVSSLTQQCSKATLHCFRAF